MWIEKFQVKKDNRLAALYPTTKLWIVLFYSICTLVLSSIDVFNLPLLTLPWIIALLILVRLSGIRKAFFKAMKKVVIISLVIFLVQTFIIPGGDLLFRFGFIRVYTKGLRTGLSLAGSILNIAGIFVWLFQTTELKELSRALEDKGMNYKVSYVFLSTMQMIDLLRRNLNVIMNAQRARGIETEGNIIVRAKAFFPSIVPLVLGAIISSEDRVLALSAKGFEVTGKKTHILKVEPSGDERLAMIISILITIIIITGRVLLWLL